MPLYGLCPNVGTIWPQNHCGDADGFSVGLEVRDVPQAATRVPKDCDVSVVKAIRIFVRNNGEHVCNQHWSPAIRS